MKKSTVRISSYELDVYSLNTVIVGSGASGFNAADSLYTLGQTDIAIVTEGIRMGASRNTGSDKQTYYKLSLEGSAPDSVHRMAETLFNGGSMHGDIALVEAALSAKCFYKLVDIGVPFPHNRYGEYVGYKTDHDPGKRATSAGPLTSKYMTEKLEAQVKNKRIPIFDGYRVIGILTRENKDNGQKSTVGLAALNLDKLKDENMGLTLFNCTNIVYAVGGPAGMYLTSVYPESQTGASGIAFEAGVAGVNLTESQYGIASTRFRWNLSGTYQQVIPRYVSTAQDGSDEQEFLTPYFESPGKLMDAVFLKGYQWPFDPRKVWHGGSSLIDLLVYQETQVKGRKAYLDFTRNPVSGSQDGQLNFSLLGQEAYTYLEKSGVLFGTPIERLAKMNMPAIELYKSNGIDLFKEYLEIDVCAQHNNGGLLGNIWWESNIKHFFPVGEVCGTFGVYRPGGSALNSTQVGSFRAAQYISRRYTEDPLDTERFLSEITPRTRELLNLSKKIKDSLTNASNVFERRHSIQENMTKNGAHIRSLRSCEEGMAFCRNQLRDLLSGLKIRHIQELPEVFINRDMLITQFVYLSAIREYIQKGGKSRGSYLIQDEQGELPVAGLSEAFRLANDTGALNASVCEVSLDIGQSQDQEQDLNQNQPQCKFAWKETRPIPQTEDWFENIWNDFRQDKIID